MPTPARNRNIGGRGKRVYLTNAERQRAYRQRQRAYLDWYERELALTRDRLEEMMEAAERNRLADAQGTTK